MEKTYAPPYWTVHFSSDNSNSPSPRELNWVDQNQKTNSADKADGDSELDEKGTALTHKDDEECWYLLRKKY